MHTHKYVNEKYFHTHTYTRMHPYTGLCNTHNGYIHTYIHISVIRKPLRICKNTNIFLMVNLLAVTKRHNWLKEGDTSHVRHLGRVCAQRLLNHPVISKHTHTPTHTHIVRVPCTAENPDCLWCWRVCCPWRLELEPQRGDEQKHCSSRTHLPTSIKHKVRFVQA
jgi:hypothetical protein